MATKDPRRADSVDKYYKLDCNTLACRTTTHNPLILKIVFDMPVPLSSNPYRAYGLGIAVEAQPGIFEDCLRTNVKILDTSPSKTLHLYEHRQLPALPSASATDLLLADYAPHISDHGSSVLASPRSDKLAHIAKCQKILSRAHSPLSDQLSLFPLPLQTGHSTIGPSYESSDNIQSPLTPPSSKFLTPTLPWHNITAANVPSGASMELEKYHGSWSIAVYSSLHTIAHFRLLIERNRSFMRKQSTRGVSRVAMMCSGLHETLKVAVTGYLDKPTDLPDYQLPNSLWTCKVFSLCQEIGHDPALSLHDHGVAGLHNCCHAEKQAVAYLHYERPSLRKAIIHLSDDPCSDCARFLRKYELKYGKDIEIIVYGWRWQDAAIGRNPGTDLRTML